MAKITTFKSTRYIDGKLCQDMQDGIFIYTNSKGQSLNFKGFFCKLEHPDFRISFFKNPNPQLENILDNLCLCTLPRYNFVSGESTHKLWVINDIVAIGAIKDILESITLTQSEMNFQQSETKLCFVADEKFSQNLGYIPFELVDAQYKGDEN